jgi:RNA polymerase sigma-70 factor, ECF subfamily
MVKEGEIFSVKKLEDFEKVFRKFFIPLTHYSFKMLRDVDSAKEIVHNVFINVWEKREQLHDNVPIRSYLFSAVYKRSLNFLRDNKKFDKSELSELAEISDPAGDHSELEDSETEARILKEIENLPDRCSEIFKLARFENKKYREIAEILDISVKTVEAQMTKALKILREKLSDIINLIILWIILFFYNFL